MTEPPQKIAFRLERVLTTPAFPPAPDWIVRDIKIVSIIDPCILRNMYADRGRRVIGRKIRQMRRRFRRNFDPAYAHYR